MSDAVKARQEQVELCRDLLLSIIHDNLTIFRRAVVTIIVEHNSIVPSAQQVAVSSFDTFLRELRRKIALETNDLTSDVIYEMSHAIEEEDAESS